MPHVDEGTLHALLDGELPAGAVQQVQTHFATCPACAARLDEARQMLAETERLLAALELPAAAGEDEPAADAPDDASAYAPPTHPAAPPADPVVLLPENPLAPPPPRPRWRTFAWAAGVLLAFGIGGIGIHRALTPPPKQEDLLFRLRPEEFKSVDAPPGPGERPVAISDSAAQLAAADVKPAPGPAAPAATKPSTPPAPAPETSAAKAPPPPAPAANAGRTAAEPKPAAKDEGRTENQVADAPAPAPERPAPDTGARRPPAPAVDHDRAAAAMRDIDRDKAAQAGARALALLDAQRREQEQRARDRARADSIQAEMAARANPPAPAAARAPANAPPAQPSIDQRAGLSSRIGLDRAARELGGPLHAIDAAGLTRQAIGLVPGNAVAGADPNRPVVRAVYADPAGRIIMLDQQRARAGADIGGTPEPSPGGGQRWVADGVLLHLHGEASPTWLASLARQVR